MSRKVLTFANLDKTALAALKSIVSTVPFRFERPLGNLRLTEVVTIFQVLNTLIPDQAFGSDAIAGKEAIINMMRNNVLPGPITLSLILENPRLRNLSINNLSLFLGQVIQQLASPPVGQTNSSLLSALRDQFLQMGGTSREWLIIILEYQEKLASPTGKTGLVANPSAQPGFNQPVPFSPAGGAYADLDKLLDDYLNKRMTYDVLQIALYRLFTGPNPPKIEETNTYITNWWEAAGWSAKNIRLTPPVYIPFVLDVKTTPLRSIQTGTLAMVVWKETLERGLLHPGMAKATDAQKLPALLRLLDITNLRIDEFNEIVRNIKGLDRIPQLAPDRTLYYYERKTTPIPQTWREVPGLVIDPVINPKRLGENEGKNVDNAIMVPTDVIIGELQAFGNYMTRILNAELASYPGDTRIAEPIRNLRNTMEIYVNEIWADWDQVPLAEYLIALQGLRDEAIRILEERRRLGRRCRNASDPLSLDDVEDIPEEDLIHLSNGNCWHIESLIDVIKGKLGLNDARDYPSYGSPRLWENNADEAKIFNHPKARDLDGIGLRNWIEVNGMAKVAAVLTPDIINFLKAKTEIFVSRGPGYLNALPRYLTAVQMAEFRRLVPDLDFYTLQSLKQIRARNPLVMPILQIIARVMKSEAMIELTAWYDELPADVKGALNAVISGFDESMTQCRAGKWCLYHLAGVITDLINKLDIFHRRPVWKDDQSYLDFLAHPYDAELQ